MKTLPVLAAFAMVFSLGANMSAHSQEKDVMTVFKSPTCGCCGAWADAMSKAGYNVKIVNLDDLSAIKKQAGVSDEMAGCHTAVYKEYVLEGHVPLEAIDKLMSEQPKIRGIATPGMPSGSLGMGYDKNARYTVYAFTNNANEKPTAFYEAGVKQ